MFDSTMWIAMTVQAEDKARTDIYLEWLDGFVLSPETFVSVDSRAVPAILYQIEPTAIVNQIVVTREARQ